MQVRALKTWNDNRKPNGLGLIRAGVVITVDERYGRQIISSGLAVKHTPPGPAIATTPGPDMNTALPGPDSTKNAMGAGDDGEDPNMGNEEEEDEVEEEEEVEEEVEEEEVETRSRRKPASGSKVSSSAGQQVGGRKRPLSSQQVGRRSRKNS